MEPYAHEYDLNVAKNIADGFCTTEESLVHNLKCYGFTPILVKTVRGVKLHYYEKYNYDFYMALADLYSPSHTKAKINNSNPII